MSIRQFPLWQPAAAVLLGFLAACVNAPPRLSVEIDTCCDARFERYETYSVMMTNVPGFLEPYLRGGIEPVLARRGLQPTLDRPDLSVRMIFDQVFLSPESAEEDYFGEGVEPDDATRFMAAVSVDVIDTINDSIVWSGRLSRIHSNPYGEPRGNDHKMQGIIDGFEELFAAYPIRLTDDDTG